jgi:hypothetical protein
MLLKNGSNGTSAHHPTLESRWLHIVVESYGICGRRPADYDELPGFFPKTLKSMLRDWSTLVESKLYAIEHGTSQRDPQSLWQTKKHMRNAHPTPDDIELLLENARLRDALEPFFDESVDRINVSSMPTIVENEFLESMLAWEQAPVLPIAQWFEPELKLAHPDLLDQSALKKTLWEMIHRLYQQRIVLDFTDHLSDRDLYCLIYRDILPSQEKKIDQPRNLLHWHCIDPTDDEELWLRFYATDLERDEWREETGGELPESSKPPFTRKMPRRPLN